MRPGGRGSTVQVTVPGNSDQGASAAVISGEAPGRHRAQDPEPGAGPGRSGGRTRCSKTPTVPLRPRPESESEPGAFHDSKHRRRAARAMHWPAATIGAVIRITVVIRRLRARGSPQARRSPPLTGRPGPGPRGAGMPVLSTDRRRGWARPGAGYRAAGPEPVSLKGNRFRPECTETGSGHECTIVSDRPSPGHPLSFCWAFTGFP